MHAIFLTFDYAGDPRSLPRFVQSYTCSISSREYGVLSSTWLNDGATAGALYTFQNLDCAERFLRSPGMRALTAHPEVSEFYVRHFSTLSTVNAALAASAITLQPTGMTPVNTPGVWQAGMDQVADQRN